jgi:methylenetetrahydrofolate reductase (NADPH)
MSGLIFAQTENRMSETPRFSFEFFPPKTEKGLANLRETRNKLNELNPEFYSVTYGAGGSTRDNTKGLVTEIKQAGIDVAPHLSFGGDDEESMLELITSYKDAGINRLVALRGDIPSGSGLSKVVYANELVEFVRKHTGDHFNIEVAAYPEIHPESKSFDSDIDFLKMKLDAGANSAITQYFYNIDAYFYFLDACMKKGIDKPIYAGIMPITNFQNLARFSANCGAEIPRWLRYKLESYGSDDASIRAFGQDYVSELCNNLLAAGAPGIHFYTMNQVEPTKTIFEQLQY